jgi:hypothetical protein
VELAAARAEPDYPRQAGDALAVARAGGHEVSAVRLARLAEATTRP